MNTRIQVEHPLLNKLVDFDLIREQTLLWLSQLISGKNYYPNYTSIECEN